MPRTALYAGAIVFLVLVFVLVSITCGGTAALPPTPKLSEAESVTGLPHRRASSRTRRLPRSREWCLISKTDEEELSHVP